MRRWGKFQKDSNFPGDPGAPIVILFKLGNWYCNIWRDSWYDKYWKLGWNTDEDLKAWKLEDYKPIDKDYHDIMHAIFESINANDWTWGLRKK